MEILPTKSLHAYHASSPSHLLNENRNDVASAAAEITGSSKFKQPKYIKIHLHVLCQKFSGLYPRIPLKRG
jgi:hypothetical protein